MTAHATRSTDPSHPLKPARKELNLAGRIVGLTLLALSHEDDLPDLSATERLIMRAARMWGRRGLQALDLEVPGRLSIPAALEMARELLLDRAAWEVQKVAWMVPEEELAASQNYREAQARLEEVQAKRDRKAAAKAARK